MLNGRGKPKYDHKFIADYSKVKNIRNVVVHIEDNETLVNEARNENKRNVNGSVMCVRYQIIENEILQCARVFFYKTRVRVRLLARPQNWLARLAVTPGTNSCS